MSNERHRGGPPTSKPQNPAAITAEALAIVMRRVEALEKLVKEHLDEKNQWNSLLREWTGKWVTIRLVDGSTIEGKLCWVDRYTMCLEKRVGDLNIVHKGAIAVIQMLTVKS